MLPFNTCVCTCIICVCDFLSPPSPFFLTHHFGGPSGTAIQTTNLRDRGTTADPPRWGEKATRPNHNQLRAGARAHRARTSPLEIGGCVPDVTYKTQSVGERRARAFGPRGANGTLDVLSAAPRTGSANPVPPGAPRIRAPVKHRVYYSVRSDPIFYQAVHSWAEGRVPPRSLGLGVRGFRHRHVAPHVLRSTVGASLAVRCWSPYMDDATTTKRFLDGKKYVCRAIWISSGMWGVWVNQ